mmetsp:Transcript_76882/g.220805  ORF Transcript_76882/g.220805 Transcript_76882/m.220805 type:complete len:374 (-) Transcript_76882:132-1253(-)
MASHTADANTETFLSPFLIRIVSSSFGSLVTALAVTPLDVVKVRQQAMMAEPTPRTKITMSQCSKCGTFVLNNGLMEHIINKCTTAHFIEHEVVGFAGSQTARGMPASTLGGMAHIYRREGLRGIYSGLSPTLVMAIPATVMYFTAYDELKYRFSPFFGEMWAAPIAGITARMFASTVTSPLELIRTLSQAGEHGGGLGGHATGGGGLVATARTIVRQGGVFGLWRGLEPTLWRDVPFSGVYWLALEQGKVALEERYPSENPLAPTARAFVAGAGAGMLAAVLVTPFDVVKTRRQLYTTLASDPAVAATIDHSASAGNGSTSQVISGILKDEGAPGLFRGAYARVLKVTPACAIMIGVYETGKRVFGLQERGT